MRSPLKPFREYPGSAPNYLKPLKNLEFAEGLEPPDRLENSARTAVALECPRGSIHGAQ